MQHSKATATALQRLEEIDRKYKMRRQDKRLDLAISTDYSTTSNASTPRKAAAVEPSAKAAAHDGEQLEKSVASSVKLVAADDDSTRDRHGHNRTIDSSAEQVEASVEIGENRSTSAWFSNAINNESSTASSLVEEIIDEADCTDSKASVNDIFSAKFLFIRN